MGKLTKVLAVMAFVSALGSADAMAATYKIDTEGAHASINFRVKHLGFSWLTGRFDLFEGSFEFDPENPASSSVSVEIDTNSVNSNHEARDNHLRSDDFLNVAEHPTATFKSTSIELMGETTAKIIGDFTLNGVTKPIVLDAEYVGGGDDQRGNNRQGFMATASFGMGEFDFKNDYGAVELTLHVEGILQ